MRGTATAEPGPTIVADHSPATELLLRIVGAVLQIVATLAVVDALAPQAVGVYFRGFVIAHGMAALLRAKYEIYIAHHIIGRRAAITGVSDGVLVLQLGRRVLLRSTLVCAVLLVITADIDIQAPRFEPALETYLPFVLSIPFISLSTFVGEALRAANRTLFGTLIAAYAVNLSIILAVALAPKDASLVLYAWAFFGGGLAAAALAVVLALRALPANWAEGARPVCREAMREADEREVIGLGRAALLWVPLCILAISADAIQMAEYAVAYRTAMIVDFFLPALNLSGGRDVLRSDSAAAASRGFLVAQLVGALFYSSVFAAALLVTALPTLRLYGYPYETRFAVYALLIGMQWANGVGRPAVRYAVVHWDAPRIRATFATGTLAALLVCGSLVGAYGALAVAAASLIGALLVNLSAIFNALRAPAPAEGRT